jgi:hypothetical protein
LSWCVGDKTPDASTLEVALRQALEKYKQDAGIEKVPKSVIAALKMATTENLAVVTPVKYSQTDVTWFLDKGLIAVHSATPDAADRVVAALIESAEITLEPIQLYTSEDTSLYPPLKVKSDLMEPSGEDAPRDLLLWLWYRCMLVQGEQEFSIDKGNESFRVWLEHPIRLCKDPLDSKQTVTITDLGALTSQEALTAVWEGKKPNRITLLLVSDRARIACVLNPDKNLISKVQVTPTTEDEDLELEDKLYYLEIIPQLLGQIVDTFALVLQSQEVLERDMEGAIGKMLLTNNNQQE